MLRCALPSAPGPSRSCLGKLPLPLPLPWLAHLQEFGRLAYVAIGATMVGSIIWTVTVGQVRQGQAAAGCGGAGQCRAGCCSRCRSSRPPSVAQGLMLSMALLDPSFSLTWPTAPRVRPGQALEGPYSAGTDPPPALLPLSRLSTGPAAAAARAGGAQGGGAGLLCIRRLHHCADGRAGQGLLGRGSRAEQVRPARFAQHPALCALCSLQPLRRRTSSYAGISGYCSAK